MTWQNELIILSKKTKCKTRRRINLPNSSSSGSFGFNVRRVKSLYKVAKTSKFSAERENTGKHWARTSPHMRITTNSSRILFSATISLLMSYFCEQKQKQLFSLQKKKEINKVQSEMNTYTGIAIHAAHATIVWKFC